MKMIKAFTLTACALALVGIACAQDGIAGKWQGEFDSQVGHQKYTYDFKVAGTNLTGRAVGVRDNGTNDVAITEGKIKQDEISFVETLKFDDNEIRIEYTGKISKDEIKLHRQVGDYGEEDFLAKRVKPAIAAPDAKADTNTPPARP